jgi:GDPmannose 4,6-dehydratase
MYWFFGSLRMLDDQKILITGAAGQDGKILSRRLMASNKSMFCLVRSEGQKNELENYCPGVEIQVLNLLDFEEVKKFISSYKPTKVYNLASSSSVELSWQNPAESFYNNVNIALNIWESLRILSHECFVITPISGDIVGNTTKIETEFSSNTQLYNSPYSIAKNAINQLNYTYNQFFGINCSAPIMYNHESPLRTSNFLSKKICQGVAQVKTGKIDKIHINNLDIHRDWGWAPDYVTGLQLIEENMSTEIYTIATGETHSVRDFLRLAFEAIGEGEWQKYVVESDLSRRPSDIRKTIGDFAKIHSELNWSPVMNFNQMIKKMVDREIDEILDPSIPIWRETDIELLGQRGVNYK